jgi:hypothetical protein
VPSTSGEPSSQPSCNGLAVGDFCPGDNVACKGLCCSGRSQQCPPPAFLVGAIVVQ